MRGNDAVNYLPDGVSYSNVVETLLMHGFSTSESWDIPFWGMFGAISPINRIFQLKAVGLDHMNRELLH